MKPNRAKISKRIDENSEWEQRAFFFVIVSSFQFNVQQVQPLSITLPPVSTVPIDRLPEPMDTRLTKDPSLLTDRPSPGTIITTVFRSDTSDNDRYRRVSANRWRNSPSMKMKLFIRRYRDLLILVFKSIWPDLKSFKCWQVCILILFATFSVVFSVLVSTHSSSR